MAVTVAPAAGPLIITVVDARYACRGAAATPFSLPALPWLIIVACPISFSRGQNVRVQTEARFGADSLEPLVRSLCFSKEDVLNGITSV